MGRAKAFISIVALVAGGSTSAATYQEGDVFASIGFGKVVQLSNSLTFKAVLDTTTNASETTGSAFDSKGNFYVTSFSTSELSKFDSAGNLVAKNFATCDAGAHCESIVFDKSDNFYVGQADGTRDILKFSSGGGAPIDRYDVETSARGSDWVELAADQKTLFYTSENYEVFTYDTDTDTQGAQFATLADRPAFANRLLDDGGMLVADGALIRRLDATGAEIQTYDDPSILNFWFALNLDPDGTSFWTGDINSAQLARFDILTGALLKSANLKTDYTEFSVNTLAGLSVFGEITQGCGGSCQPPDDGAVVPLPAAAVLLLSGIAGLGELGSLRRRQRS